MSQSSFSFATNRSDCRFHCGCELLCFLDAYSGYDKIKMKESDQLATSFITPFGMFPYVTMPFGLEMRALRTSDVCNTFSGTTFASHLIAHGQMG
jgi:hypothetical protein